MCRMIAAPLGLPGDCLVDPFLRMAQGRNTLNEVNTMFGKITHGDGWGAVCGQEGELTVRRSTCGQWVQILILSAFRRQSPEGRNWVAADVDREYGREIKGIDTRFADLETLVGRVGAAG